MPRDATTEDPTLARALQAAEVDENAQREAEASVDVRLAMMHTDGLNAEIIYPTIGLYVYGIERPDVGVASCRSYNDWIHEHLGDECPRVRYAALIPTWDTESAVAEVRRVAVWRGVSALMLPLVGTPSWNMANWEPLWDAVDETGLPVTMHQGTGHNMIFYRGWGSPTANLLATQSMAPRTAALLACGGVLERHPDLHVVLVDFTAHRARERKPHLRELPSHYLRRQLHATFQRDPVGIAARGITGVDCLMWGNDFPHAEGTFPDSATVLADILSGVSFDEAARITGGNALSVFGFDPQVCASTP